tara:strand:+ start:10718 stop:10849 length:132 start_codon:yes stop_codon:yes gene_type:complete
MKARERFEKPAKWRHKTGFFVSGTRKFNMKNVTLTTTQDYTTI